MVAGREGRAASAAPESQVVALAAAMAGEVMEAVRVVAMVVAAMAAAMAVAMAGGAMAAVRVEAKAVAVRAVEMEGARVAVEVVVMLEVTEEVMAVAARAKGKVAMRAEAAV
jgi:hypothetical protein